MNHTDQTQTIVAQCTPTGSGALALIRLSGPTVIATTDLISSLANNKRISTVPTHTIQYGWVIDAHKTSIDQVLFLIMHGPKTFTGDDTVEITCHNNPFIVNAIIDSAIAAGARLAQAGEFSRRAVANNKINITQAEAINELIHANTQQALKQSLAQLKGSFSNWITKIEKELIKALAFAQASFEFIDEEDMEFSLDIKQIIITVIEQIHVLKKTFDQQKQIRDGIRIAIIGTVNAGKSSFFNALLDQNRAIVSPIAGTTRDVIEAGLYKNGNYWTLIDTAGLRKTDDIIEQLGIDRSHEQAQKADIILLAFDSSTPFSTSEEIVYNQLVQDYAHKTIIIKNKSDLPERNSFQSSLCQTLNFSSILHRNVNIIEQSIETKIRTLFATIQSPFLLNQRHFNELLTLESSLITVLPMLNGPVSYELVSVHLQDALATLSELTGKTVSENSMNAIFREFCIGK